MEFVLLYLIAQTASADFERFGGPAFISVVFAERFLNKRPVRC